MKGVILDYLKTNEVEYKEKHLLSSISPIRIGGMADYIIFPNSDRELVELVALFRSLKMPYKIVGRMSNVLFSDEGYEGVILRTDRISEYRVSGNRLSASCGVSLPFIASILSDFGLSGLEQLSGIPGSIAGAITGNAGAFGREISDSIIGVRVFDPLDNRIFWIDKNGLDFSYRSSLFKRKELVILSAELLLLKSDVSSIKSEMERCKRIRTDRQPTKELSLGSTFKRPSTGLYAAKLIDECGIKGYSIGGAKISEKHAGFVVNTGGATAKDYIELSKYAKNCVSNEFGINLEYEIEII